MGRKSENIGVRFAVLKSLLGVINNSIEAEIHPDYLKDEERKRRVGNGYDDSWLVHRFFGAVEIDGKVYRVKTTMLEYQDKNKINKPHSYEVTKIELFDDPKEGKSDSSWHSMVEKTPNIDAAKLLKDVEKSYDPGKKLLDESKKVHFSVQKKVNRTSLNQTLHVRKKQVER